MFIRSDVPPDSSVALHLSQALGHLPLPNMRRAATRWELCQSNLPQSLRSLCVVESQHSEVQPWVDMYWLTNGNTQKGFSDIACI